MAAEVLVVGGTSGLGFELAKTYRSRGANVTITGRDEEKSGAVAVDCGDGVRSIALDLAAPRTIAEGLADIGTSTGSLITRRPARRTPSGTTTSTAPSCCRR